MIRKLLTTLAVLGLLMLPSVASAAVPTYPAPPVTPESAIPASIEPITTAPAGVSSSVTSLATTGDGFNVGLTVLIAAAVLAVGVGLLLAGRRSRRSGAEH